MTAVYCPTPDCLEDGCRPERPCCPGHGCICLFSAECPTRVTDYHDDGTTLRFCPNHKTEYTHVE